MASRPANPSDPSAEEDGPFKGNGPAVAMLWEEQRRLLTRQEASLDTLRIQAVAILTAASVVAAFFGSRVLPHPATLASGWAVGVALALFIVTFALSLDILRPRTWTFEHDLATTIKQAAEEHITEDELGYEWAKGFEKCRTKNATQLESLMNEFIGACLLTGLQVVAWVLSLLLR